MSSAATVPILAPDGQVRDVPQSQASTAIASGGRAVTKMLDPQGAMRWAPNDQLEDLKAKGGTPVNADGSFTITPAPGESFQDTMMRAAHAGKSVGPELLQQQ